MYEKVISFDIDGVLANFTRGFTRIAHELFGTPVGDGASQETWMFEDYPQLGLTKAHCKWPDGPIWDRIRTNPDFWTTLDPLNVSIMARINRIRNRVFITNRLGVNPQEQSERFLRAWGIEDPYVILAEKKAPVACQYFVVAHVDDYYKNVVELKTALPQAFIALHYTPYNKIHHAEWASKYAGDVTLSVDHFIDVCERRGYVAY